MNEIPAEVWEMAMRVALERIALWRGRWGKMRQQEAEARRVLMEAESWPLNRCVDILPFVGQVGEHSAGLFDDGRLCFAVGLFWMAPFPAHTVSLDFQCEIPHDEPIPGRRSVVYTVRNHKVTQGDTAGKPEQIDGGSLRMVGFELTPDNPVSLEELGPASPHVKQTKIVRRVDIKRMQITAHAPWKCVRDTEYRPDFSFWVPRW